MAQRVRIKDEQIKVVKNWPELTSIKDIQVFIGFANFYQRFIQGFSKITALLISVLKINGSSKKSALGAFKAGNKDVVEGDNNKTVVDSSKFKNEKSRKLTCISSIRNMEKPNFLTLDVKKAFNYLWLAFIKALILQHFDLESYI